MQIDKYTLYGTRLLVFLEDAPQSNEYRQICVNEKQFKALSDAVCTVQSREGDDELVMIQMSEETYKLPDLQEIYLTQEDKIK